MIFETFEEMVKNLVEDTDYNNPKETRGRMMYLAEQALQLNKTALMEDEVMKRVLLKEEYDKECVGMMHELVRYSVEEVPKILNYGE